MRSQTKKPQAKASALTAKPVVAEAAPPARTLEETGVRAPISGVAILVLSLFAFGALLLSASAVPAARVPWPGVAESLYVHRSDLAAVGIGALALGLLCLNVAVLF